MAQVLCILTSFWVMCASKNWLKHFQMIKKGWKRPQKVFQPAFRCAQHLKAGWKGSTDKPAWLFYTCDGWKMRCELILPRNEMRGEITECYFYQTLSVSNIGESGSDSRFVLEVIIKALISKSSQSSILKTPNRLHPIHDFPPESSLSEYLNFHTCL